MCAFLDDVYVLCQRHRVVPLFKLLRESPPQFIAEKLRERVEEERRLWDAIPTVTDLQCAWQLLVQSANPWANHTLRTLPLSLSSRYAQDHDDGIWATVGRGGVGIEIYNQARSGGILGVMGGRVGHD